MNTATILALLPVPSQFTASSVTAGLCLTCNLVEGHRISDALGRATVALRGAGYDTMRAGSCLYVSEPHTSNAAPWDADFAGYEACECGAEHSADCECDDADPVSGERTGQRGRSDSAATYESEARRSMACRAEVGW